MENIKQTQYATFEWLDVAHPSKKQIETIADENNLDLFQIVDSLEHGHLPKFEKLPNYSFIILRAYVAKNNDRFSTVSELTNKIAFFYNDQKIITIHRANFSFLKQLNSDFASPNQLVLTIINKMIETFVEPSNWHSTKIDNVEKTLFLKDFSKISLEELYFQKAQTRISKKLLQISQDVVSKIHVNEESYSALQDIKDQIFSLILIYEEVSDDASSLMNTYLSITTTKNNDVMRLLTIFSAFFLPLTFIVGIYGMNFDVMPELRWNFGYPIIMGGMIIICLAIYFWFKRKQIM